MSTPVETTATAPAPAGTTAGTTAVAVGAALTALGPVAYLGSGGASATALLPSALGVVILVLGLVARNPERRKHAMHGAAVVAAVGALGSLRVVADVPAAVSGDGDVSGWAVGGQLVTLALCGALLAVCIGSFRAARRATA